LPGGFRAGQPGPDDENFSGHGFNCSEELRIL
jgi:hypothetical protein